MKTLKFISIALAGALLVLSACKKDNGNEPQSESSIKVTPTELSFTKDGGTQELTLNVSNPWKAEVDAEWCTLSAYKGDKDAFIDVTAEASTSEKETTAVIKFSDTRGNTASVTVKRAGTGDKPGPTPTGEAYATAVGGNVKWVQLWENGPKWAEYNVGAKSVGEYGGYYCWGKTKDKDPNGDYYNGEENIQGGSHDTAKNLWGDNWQMATKEDFDALLANCDVQWTTNYNGTGKAGRVYTGKTEGYTENSVFFPSAGYYDSGEVYCAGSYGNYWSSTPLDSDYAYYLYFNSSNQYVDYNYRYYGQSVRAVLK